MTHGMAERELYGPLYGLLYGLLYGPKGVVTLTLQK